MFASGSAANWLGIGVGAVILAQAVALVVRRRRSGDADRERYSLVPMMFCMGVMFFASSAARLRGWGGTGELAAFAISTAAALATIVLAVRSLARRAPAAETASPLGLSPES